MVPNGWKRSCITPLFKEGDKTEPGNYRPVAILPACRAHKRTSTIEMHKMLDLMRLEPQREFHLQCVCHSNIYCDSNACLSKFFEPVGLNRKTTRAANNKNMKVPNIQSIKGRMAFRYKGPVSWNKRDNSYKCIEKYTTF